MQALSAVLNSAGRPRRISRGGWFAILVLASVGLGACGGERTRILAIGDSFVSGAGVAAAESFPAQLHQLLSQHAPGRYGVVNLGMPGMSTVQVRNRLEANVDRYAPDLVLLLGGVNDMWNLSEKEVSTSLRAQSGLRDRLRAEWSRVAAPTRRDGRRQASESSWKTGTRATVTLGQGADERKVTGQPRLETWTARHGGTIDRIENYHGPKRTAAEMEALVEREIEEIIRFLQARSIPVWVLLYPRSLGSFANANAAIARAAANNRAVLIDTAPALARLPEANRVWIKGVHPGAATYREIAAELLPRLLTVKSSNAPLADQAHQTDESR